MNAERYSVYLYSLFLDRVALVNNIYPFQFALGLSRLDNAMRTDILANSGISYVF